MMFFLQKDLIPLPKPEFFVLYNGTEDLKEAGENGTTKIVTEKLMKLSDAFTEKNKSENSLELCVKLIDVKYGRKHQSLRKDGPCGKRKENLSLLGEYSYFISKVEEYKKQKNNLENAIKAAAKHCIENDILREFLLKNETEVVVMLFGVYEEEMEKQVIREEAEARGEARGRKEERAKAEKRIIKERARTTIDMALDFGCSNEEILSTLQKKLKATKQQAEEYLKKFYDKTL